MNYTTHPNFEAGYDCPKFETIQGERRYHALGDKPKCVKCETYLSNF